MCAIPASDPDDDAALLALPHSEQFLGRLSYKFCLDCACLADHNLCDELRPGLPGLDETCGTSCAKPRSLEQRGCVSASLPTPAWPENGDGQGYGDGQALGTPADEYPSVRDACQAGTRTIADRTAGWLALAADYLMQAAEGNAGVIATQICLERRYVTLTCLEDPAASLTDLHDQACALVESLRTGYKVDRLLSTTDVPPLSLGTYHTTFTTLSSYLGTVQNRHDSLQISSDFLRALSAEVAKDSADAADEAGVWQAKADADQSRMDVYRTQIQGIDATLQQTLQTMQVDGPALLQSTTDQIDAARADFHSAANGENLALQPAERGLLEAQQANLQSKQAEIQQQLGTHRRLQDDGEHQQLLHRLTAVAHLLAWVRQRLQDLPSSTVPTNQSTCPASCDGATPPSSNGCGNDFTGSFHSWAMQALQDVTGCYSVPYLMDDMQPCCDAHDICYGTCGVTQAFCDEQLHECVQSQAVLPACQTTVDTTDLTVQLLGCSHFTAAQEESVAQQCRSKDADQGCVNSCSDPHACIQTAEHVCDTVGALAGAIVASPVGNAACTGIDVVAGFVGAPGLCHEALAGVQTVASAASYGLSKIDEAWDTVSSWLGRRLQESCGSLDPTSCQQMQQQLTQLQGKLQAAKRLISTVSSLAALNTQLLGPDNIDPAALAKLDMSFLDLDMLNDQVLV
eukprot:COSAG02_NODE_8490_length_2552_cov_1.863025_1_plen_685_part_10